MGGAHFGPTLTTDEMILTVSLKKIAKKFKTVASQFRPVIHWENLNFLPFSGMWSIKSLKFPQNMPPCYPLGVARYICHICYRADSSGRPSHKCIIMNQNFPHLPLRTWQITAWHHFLPRSQSSSFRGDVSSTSVSMLDWICSLSYKIKSMCVYFFVY